jgi:post-segregation antitoxin (ccd killing protein)
MALTKTSITIPDDLLEEARAASNNFSALVTEALKEYLRRRNIRKAMESFGSWEDREGTSAEVVNRMRSKEGRDYAGRAD